MKRKESLIKVSEGRAYNHFINTQEWKMNPSKVIREKVEKLTDLPNIGKTVAADLARIGITSPDQLKGEDPYDLYLRFCTAFGEKQDPCILDVLMSITDFMDGGEPRVWWDYTAERKRLYGSGRIEN